MSTTKNKKPRKLTSAMARQIRRLYFATDAIGALEYGERFIPDVNGDNGKRASYDCSEWPFDSEFDSEFDSLHDLDDGIGEMDVYEDLHLDLYVYLPTDRFGVEGRGWGFEENICVRFNGSEWELTEYPELS
jgi:hypothetical protein